MRETCKNLPQQYQAYLTVIGESHQTTPFEDFVEWVFGYRPNSADVESLKKKHPTCEKSKYLSFPINEEAINTYNDII